MRAQVLGPVRLERGGSPVPVPAGNVGRLLTLLLLRPNEARPVPDLVAHLWPDEPDGPAPRRRLQVTVSRLQAFLQPEGADGLGALDVVHDDGGYRLVAPPESLDRAAFEALAAGALHRNDRTLARRALRLWGGHPYQDLPASAELRTEQRSLTQLHHRLVDLRDGPPRPDVQLRRGLVQPPAVVGEVVERVELLARVPAVGEARAITVVAPAGAGKSTFLVQWAAQQAVPVAWLSLDRAHEDPTRFWGDLLHSLRWATGRAIELPDGAAPGSADFLDELGQLADPAGTGFGIVLDDLHVVGPSLGGDVARLVEQLPRSCTVVLSSRVHPPVATARLEATGEIHHVGARHLHLSVEEIEAATGTDLHVAARLHRVTEGWPVAVMALHRSGAAVPDEVPEVVGRYVMEEVLRSIPSDVTRAVLELAHLDAFDAALARAATGRDVRGPLAWLRRNGLFLVDLGSTHGDGWSRLHHLVAAAARRYGAEAVDARAILRRAGRWCRTHGATQAALEYAVRAGDADTVAALAGDVLLDTAISGEAHTCVRLLRTVGPEAVEHDLFAHSVALYLATEWMSVAERAKWVRSRHRHFGGEDDLVLELVEATEAMRQGRSTEAVERTRRVMEGAEAYGAGLHAGVGAILRASAASNHVRARAFQGTAASDDPLYAEAVAALRPYGPLLATWVSSYWGLVALVEGDIPMATAQAETFYLGRRAKELSRPVRRDNSVLGALLAARTTADPDRLTELAAGIADLPPHLSPRGQHTDVAVAELALAHLYCRAGDESRARTHRAQAEVLLRTFEDAPLLERLRDVLDAAVAPAATGPASRPGADRSARSGVAPARVDGKVLTPRQQTIAGLLHTELTTREMAAQLHISHHTLRTHLRDIYRRLGVTSRHQAVALLRGR